MQVVVMPAIIVSGVLMWQQPRLSKFLKSQNPQR